MVVRLSEIMADNESQPKTQNVADSVASSKSPPANLNNLESLDAILNQNQITTSNDNQSNNINIVYSSSPIVIQNKETKISKNTSLSISNTLK